MSYSVEELAQEAAVCTGGYDNGPVARARADGLLEAVGLKGSAGAAFRTYSGGMRQKLGIARGSARRPGGPLPRRSPAARWTRSRHARCAR